VTRRQRLSTTQIAELFDPPTEQRELVRHFTLAEADLAAIRRCRGDHNRLGYALLLCYLRFPGRPLRPGEPRPRRAYQKAANQAVPGTQQRDAAGSAPTRGIRRSRLAIRRSDRRQTLAEPRAVAVSGDARRGMSLGISYVLFGFEAEVVSIIRKPWT
jgi:Domain of unknown function (DUF4158)